MTRGASLLLIALAATTASAAAEEGRNRLEVTGFVGGMTLEQGLGTASSIYLSVTGAAADVDFGKLFGARASWAFTENVAAAFDFSRSTNAYRLDVDDEVIGSVGLGEQFEAERLSFGGSVVAQYPLASGLVPYGSFGVGRLATKPRRPIAEIDSVTATDVSFGGGVKYWVPKIPWLGVGFDLRYHTASKGLTFPGGDDSPTGVAFTVGGIVRLF